MLHYCTEYTIIIIIDVVCVVSMDSSVGGSQVVECRLCKDGMHCHIRSVFHMTRERGEGREGRRER